MTRVKVHEWLTMRDRRKPGFYCIFLIFVPTVYNCAETHIFTINFDAAPSIMTFMVDGVLCDGGGTQKYVRHSSSCRVYIYV